jgi:hypothetical protein
MRRSAILLVVATTLALLPATTAAAQDEVERGTMRADITHPTATPTATFRRTETPPPQGYRLLDDEFLIDAPPASANDPMRITFRVHRSLLDDSDPATLRAFRNGARSPTCRTQNRAEPDPCSFVRSITTNQVTLEVQTSRASTWSLGVPRVPEGGSACEGRAVPSAEFRDTAGNTHQRAIDCIVWHGIAQGTSPTTYAPVQPVRRDQMASFIARTVEVAGATLPQGRNQFTDLGGNTHRDSIERLAAAGIVQGVGADRYAPGASVTRGQMGSFLARAFAFVDGEQLPVAETRFTDIAGTTHEDNIRRVAGAGFAQGRTPTTYAPGDDVRRDQMASFLTRMLERFADDGRLTPN